MREHPAIGAQIVERDRLALAPRAGRPRRARALGRRRLPGRARGRYVPLASRICLVCDAWHAMTSDRPYRRALTPEQARAELKRRNAGTQFCPDTVAALERVLDRGGAPPAEPGEPLDAPSALPRVRPDRPLEAELRALITISSAVAGAHRFEDVLDIVAEEACRVAARRARVDQPLGAATATACGRWSTPASSTPARSAARTNETWTLTALDRTLVRRAAVRDRARARRAARPRSAGSSSASAAAPRSPRRSAASGRVWGVLEAYSAAARRRSPRRTCRFAEALCAQVATAIGRAELFSRLEDARLPGPAHRAAEPPRAGRAAGGGGRTARWPQAATWRCCSATSTGSRTSTTATATTRATARSPPPGGARRRRATTSRRDRPAGSAGTSSASSSRATAPRRRARSRATRRAGSPRAPTARSTLSCGVACLDDEHRALRRPVPRGRRGAVRGQAGRRRQAVRRRARDPDARRSRRPSRGRAGASATRGRQEREALVRYLLGALDAELRGAGELARLEAVTDAFAEALRRGALGDLAPRPRLSATSQTLLGAERRDRYDEGAPRHALHRAGREPTRSPTTR